MSENSGAFRLCDKVSLNPTSPAPSGGSGAGMAVRAKNSGMHM